MFIAALSTVLFLVFVSLIGRRLYIRGRLRQRLLFGISEPEETSDVNLTAGDYGLEGGARAIYHLTEFLNTRSGYLIIFLIGVGLNFLLSSLYGKNFLSNNYLASAISGIALLLVVKLILLKSKQSRSTSIRFELPNALEMIAAIMESGLGFESALGHVLREADKKHPLYFDLSVMNEAMQRGRRRNEALRLWAIRAKEPSISDISASMIQADQTGASLGTVLKHHAMALQKENESFMMKRAEKLPVKMLIPMVLLILPPIFIIAAGPSIIRIFQIFKEIMGRA